MAALNRTLAETGCTSNLNKKHLIRIIALFPVTLWIMGFLFPVISNQPVNRFLEFILSEIYSPVCHREPGKCIELYGNLMLVCARCAGIYSGALIAAVLSVFFINMKISEKLMLIAFLLMLTDVVSTQAGIYDYSKLLSFSSGLLSGFCIYIYLISELDKFSFLQKKIHE